MPKAKPLSKQQIVAAMSRTKSNRAASRYLNVSYPHYKKWAKLYKDEKSNKTLFDVHLNPMGKGIPKFLNNKGKLPAILDLIEGRADPSSFDPEKIKLKLINEGYLLEECQGCGFKERRALDYRMPLLMNFKDKNKQNYRQENVELLCYNCFYLRVGEIFTDEQIKGIEDHKPLFKGQVEWQLDDYHYERLKELGLEDNTPLNDGSEFISTI